MSEGTWPEGIDLPRSVHHIQAAVVGVISQLLQQQVKILLVQGNLGHKALVQKVVDQAALGQGLVKQLREGGL